MNQQSQNQKSQPLQPSLIDTHCHIHEADYPLDVEEVLQRAREANVNTLICVGTSEQSSADALEFAKQHENIYATIGVHPHDTRDGWGKIEVLAEKWMSQQTHMDALQGSSEARNEPYKKYGEVSTGAANAAMRHETPRRLAVPDDRAAARLVGIGEIGLDYFYTHSPREVQIKALESQIQTALDHNLPIIFHVRDGFADFWPIFDNFHGIRGELHSFTDTKENLEQGLTRGLYVGVNGISTFTKDAAQQAMFASIPLDRMLLETDAPFLTPAPKRGTINEPAFVKFVAEFHAKIRGISVQDVASATTANAENLFVL